MAYKSPPPPPTRAAPPPPPYTPSPLSQSISASTPPTSWSKAPTATSQALSSFTFPSFQDLSVQDSFSESLPAPPSALPSTSTSTIQEDIDHPKSAHALLIGVLGVLCGTDTLDQVLGRSAGSSSSSSRSSFDFDFCDSTAPPAYSRSFSFDSVSSAGSASDNEEWYFPIEKQRPDIPKRATKRGHRHESTAHRLGNSRPSERQVNRDNIRLTRTKEDEMAFASIAVSF